MPPRSISISVLCLLQLAALIGSRLLSGGWMRAWLESEEEPAWNDLLSFSIWGIWLLLLLPVACVVLSARFSATHKGMALVEDWCFWVTMAVTIGIFYYGINIVGEAMTGPPRSYYFW